MHKRSILKLTLAAAAAMTAGIASAAFPEHPIKLVVPFPSGGQAYSIAHLLSLKMSAALGQPVGAEAKPGAGGASGATPAATGMNPFASSAAWARFSRSP